MTDFVAAATLRSGFEQMVERAQLDTEHAADVLKQMDGFISHYQRYQAMAETGANTVEWAALQLPTEDDVLRYDTLDEVGSLDEARELYSKLAVLKLNGGLGTTMGCRGPKSKIAVRDGLSFLDLTVLQIKHLNEKYNVDIPLVLMNSFNTDRATKEIVRKYEGKGVRVLTFNQSCYPRIRVSTMRPLDPDYLADREGWYPPGHGDVYPSLVRSGVLAKLRELGKETLFLSNVDNLGATCDLRILKRMEKHKFIMEVTDKTQADIKGGTLVVNETGHMQLLELAQVPRDKVEDFKSITKFKIFNTNNMWVRLDAVADAVAAGMELDLIVNPKRTQSGSRVVQLESAAGAAIRYFEGAVGVNVPRTRFLPVKSTSDLFLVQSNLYELGAEYSMKLSAQRVLATQPLVKLGDAFKSVSDYQERFGSIPNVLELDHLTISGDVRIGRNVTLKGTVIIVAAIGGRIDIPDGAMLQNKVISGSLIITDH